MPVLERAFSLPRRKMPPEVCVLLMVGQSRIHMRYETHCCGWHVEPLTTAYALPFGDWQDQVLNANSILILISSSSLFCYYDFRSVSTLLEGDMENPGLSCVATIRRVTRDLFLIISSILLLSLIARSPAALAPVTLSSLQQIGPELCINFFIY